MGGPKRATVNIRLKKSVHHRWQEARVLGKFIDSSLAEILNQGLIIGQLYS